MLSDYAKSNMDEQVLGEQPKESISNVEGNISSLMKIITVPCTFYAVYP